MSTVPNYLGHKPDIPHDVNCLSHIWTQAMSWLQRVRTRLWGETLTHVHASGLPSGKSLPQQIPGTVYYRQSLTRRNCVFVSPPLTVLQAYFTTCGAVRVRAINGFVPVFIPRYADPTYRETAPANFELTPEEESLLKNTAGQRPATMAAQENRAERSGINTAGISCRAF